MTIFLPLFDKHLLLAQLSSAFLSADRIVSQAIVPGLNCHLD